MTTFTISQVLFVASILLSFAAAQDNGQRACYFPSGIQSPVDIPCASTSGEVMCCPLNWECLTNGLCQNPAEKGEFLQRDSCTDQSFKDPACPNICTYNNKKGGEALEFIQHCSNGKYCCDADRNQGNCCNDTSISYLGLFDLPSPQAFASIVGNGQSTSVSAMNNIAAPTSLPVATGPYPVSGSASASASGSGSSAGKTHVSTVTGTNGQVSYVTVGTQSTGTSSNSNSGSSSHTGTIVGAAVGSVAGVAAIIIAVLLLLLRRRKRQNVAELEAKNEAVAEKRRSSSDDTEKGLAAKDAKPSELDSSVALVPPKNPVEIDGNERYNTHELPSTNDMEPVELDSSPAYKTPDTPTAPRLPIPDSNSNNNNLAVPSSTPNPNRLSDTSVPPSPHGTDEEGTLNLFYQPSPVAIAPSQHHPAHSHTSSTSSAGGASFYSPDSVSASTRNSLDQPNASSTSPHQPLAAAAVPPTHNADGEPLTAVEEEERPTTGTGPIPPRESDIPFKH